jgi:hypothetical protein
VNYIGNIDIGGIAVNGATATPFAAGVDAQIGIGILVNDAKECSEQQDFICSALQRWGFSEGDAGDWAEAMFATADAAARVIPSVKVFDTTSWGGYVSDNPSGTNEWNANRDYLTVDPVTQANIRKTETTASGSSCLYVNDIDNPNHRVVDTPTGIISASSPVVRMGKYARLYGDKDKDYTISSPYDSGAAIGAHLVKMGLILASYFDILVQDSGICEDAMYNLSDVNNQEAFLNMVQKRYNDIFAVFGTNYRPVWTNNYSTEVSTAYNTEFSFADESSHNPYSRLSLAHLQFYTGVRTLPTQQVTTKALGTAQRLLSASLPEAIAFPDYNWKNIRFGSDEWFNILSQGGPEWGTEVAGSETAFLTFRAVDLNGRIRRNWHMTYSNPGDGSQFFIVYRNFRTPQPRSITTAEVPYFGQIVLYRTGDYKDLFTTQTACMLMATRDGMRYAGGGRQSAYDNMWMFRDDGVRPLVDIHADSTEVTIVELQDRGNFRL